MENHNLTMAKTKQTKKRAGGKAQRSKLPTQKRKEAEQSMSPKDKNNRERIRRLQKRNQEEEQDPTYSDEDLSEEGVERPKLIPQASPSDPDSDDSDDETVFEEDEEPKKKKAKNDTKLMEFELALVKKQLALQSKPKPKTLPTANKTSKLTPIQRHIVKSAQQHLFQRCKFIKNEQYLQKATKMVMEIANPIEFVGLGAKDLRFAQLEWCQPGGGNENLVRTSVNAQRNYCLNELHDLYTKKVFPEGKQEEWPNDKDIYDLAMRNGMKEGDKTNETYREKMVLYWEVMLVKVAGMAYWCVVDCCFWLRKTYLVQDSNTLPSFSSIFSKEPQQAIQGFGIHCPE